jgi:hypothetical protein
MPHRKRNIARPMIMPATLGFVKFDLQAAARQSNFSAALTPAATSSKPCGAAATCCASRTKSKSAFPPDPFPRRALSGSRLPTGPRRKWRGFCFGHAPAGCQDFQCLVIPGCALSRADPESSNVHQLLDSGFAPRGAPRNDGISRPPVTASPTPSV